MTTNDHGSDEVRGNKIIVWMQSRLDGLTAGSNGFPRLTDRQAMNLLELRTFDGRVAGLRYGRARER
jgi:hypothetical protein